MASVIIDDASLIDAGNAIREKNGLQTKYKPSEMGAAIRAIEGADNTPIPLQGNLDSINSGGKISSFFNVCGKNVQFGDVTNGTSMHSGASNLTEAPFAGGTFENMFANCTNLKRIYEVKRIGYHDYDEGCSAKRAFYNCKKLEEIGANIRGNLAVTRGKSLDASEMFYGCNNLKKITGQDNFFGSKMYASSVQISNMFKNCYALKELNYNLLYKLITPSPDTVIHPYWGTITGSYAPYTSSYNGVFEGCLSLRAADIIFYENTSDSNYNPFQRTFDRCAMISSIVPCSSELGLDSPICHYNGIIFNLTTCGYASTPSDATILEGLYGPPVTTDEEYAAHKNDPDWWTNDPKYSRYNVESAIYTLRHLPKMSRGSRGNVSLKLDAGAGTDTKDGPNTGAINSTNTLLSLAISNANDYGWSVGFN